MVKLHQMRSDLNRRLANLFPMVLNVPDLSPGKRYLGRQLVILFVDVKPKGIHTHPQLCAFLVLELYDTDYREYTNNVGDRLQGYIV